MTLERLQTEATAYIQALADMEKSKNTIKKYSLAIRKFMDYAVITANSTEISKDCVIGYKKFLMALHKPSTVNLYIVALNKYLQYLGEHELCIKTLKIHTRTSLENCLTVEEYKKMLNIAKAMKNNTIYYVMRTLSNTGIRISELAFITVGSINEGSCEISNKGKIRSVVIPNGVCKELIDFCKTNNISDGYVFRARNPQKLINEVTVLRWLKKIAVLAGVDKTKAFPHNLRHLFAKTFMEKHNDLGELADILGHTKIETTRIYTRTSIDEKRRKLDNLDL